MKLLSLGSFCLSISLALSLNAATYDYGGTHIQVDAVQGADPTLRIVIEGFAQEPREGHIEWYLARRNNPGDRFGERAYWLDPVAPLEKRQSQCEYWYPDLVKNHRFEINLQTDLSTPEKRSEWGKLTCLEDDWKASLVLWKDIGDWARPIIKKLLDDNHKWIDKVVYENLKDESIDKSNRGVWAADGYLSAPRDSAKEQLQRLLGNALNPPLEKLRYTSAPLEGKALIAVHSNYFDYSQSSRAAANKILPLAKAAGYKIAFLIGDDGEGDDTWFARSVAPDLVEYSENGEHSIQFEGSEAIMFGGYDSECLRNALIDTITRHFIHHEEKLTINFPMSAIYTHEGVKHGDSYDLMTLDDLYNQKRKSITWFKKYIVDKTILSGYQLLGGREGDEWVPNTVNQLVTGVPTLEDYAVNIFLEGDRVLTKGSGPREVDLKYWPGDWKP